jgi:molybdate transport system substrate-binding protein
MATVRPLCVAVLLVCGTARAEAPLRVAAASDLAQVLGEIGALYEKQSGRKVSISFGSSGLLARQIEEGAPFDLYAAASVAYVDEVVHKGACSGETQAKYARGRLAIWSAGGAVPTPDQLSQPRYKKIAIANPQHAPYGRAAMQAFEQLAMADDIKRRLVFGENVQQALQYARSGNADVAVVALSLVSGDKGRYTLIDEALHDPIDQALVVCGKDAARRKEAAAFAKLLAAPEGRAILERYGFTDPGRSK